MLEKREVLLKLKSLEKELGRKPVKRDNSYLYYLSRKHFGSWNKMIHKAGYECKDFQKPIIPDKLTNELFYLLGLVTTDGHIQALEKANKYRVMIYTSEKEEVEIILKLIYDIFKYRASVRGRKTGFSKRINYETYISSKKIALFFNSLGIPFGAKSYNIQVPNLIYQSGEDNFWNYLRGIFDGDGSIIFQGYNSVFKIASGSEKFLNQLKDILNTKGFRNFKVSKQDTNVWALRTNMKEDIKGIHKLIYKEALFYYPRKKLKWDNQYV